MALWREQQAVLADITVLGPYTYLATEVVFGSVAAALLWRAGALRRAARTIAALYPIAYVWDWYTLEVGVFAIPMRTGVELLGIPLEEHVFIVVVPAFVLGIHENLHGGPADREAEGTSTGDTAVGESEETAIEGRVDTVDEGRVDTVVGRSDEPASGAE